MRIAGAAPAGTAVDGGGRGGAASARAASGSSATPLPLVAPLPSSATVKPSRSSGAAGRVAASPSAARMQATSSALAARGATARAGRRSRSSTPATAAHTSSRPPSQPRNWTRRAGSSNAVRSVARSKPRRRSSAKPTGAPAKAQGASASHESTASTAASSVSSACRMGRRRTIPPASVSAAATPISGASPTRSCGATAWPWRSHRVTSRTSFPAAIVQASELSQKPAMLPLAQLHAAPASFKRVRRSSRSLSCVRAGNAGLGRRPQGHELWKACDAWSAATQAAPCSAVRLTTVGGPLQSPVLAGSRSGTRTQMLARTAAPPRAKVYC